MSDNSLMHDWYDICVIDRVLDLLGDHPSDVVVAVGELMGEIETRIRATPGLVDVVDPVYQAHMRWQFAEPMRAVTRAAIRLRYNICWHSDDYAHASLRAQSAVTVMSDYILRLPADAFADVASEELVVDRAAAV